MEITDDLVKELFKNEQFKQEMKKANQGQSCHTTKLQHVRWYVR